MKGDTLILDCTLQDKLPKASIDWKFSNNPTKPLPVRTITSRNQLILKAVTESLDPISCYASVGIVSWEQKFEISFLSTSEIKKKHQDDKIPNTYLEMQRLIPVYTEIPHQWLQSVWPGSKSVRKRTSLDSNWQTLMVTSTSFTNNESLKYL